MWLRCGLSLSEWVIYWKLEDGGNVFPRSALDSWCGLRGYSSGKCDEVCRSLEVRYWNIKPYRVYSFLHSLPSSVME